MIQGNALIIQSGGPTAVINQSLAGVMQAAKSYPEITRVLGANHGLHGLLHENLLDLSAEDENIWLEIANSPGAALGSARMKPKASDFTRIFEVLTAHNIKFLFYIGGNDSAEAAQLIRKAANERNFAIRILHIPKTIDNDLMVTDHCPGYGSVAKVVSHIIAGDDLDNRSFYNSIKVNVVMGRHAGWVAAATALAKKGHIDVAQHDELGPHLIYLPELEFSAEKFVHDVQVTYNRLERVTIVVAEGIADQLGGNFIDDKDEFGNPLLSSSGKLGDYLVSLIKKKITYNHALGKLRCRADTFGYLQRSLVGMASPVDQQEAFRIGAMAVHYMMRGETDKMVCLERVNGNPYKVTTGLCDLTLVAQKTKLMPRSMINKEGHGVTEEFYEYAMPLVGHLPELRALKASRLTQTLGKYTRPE
jgi:ATP-dependent phosphofructokinase / diphosphate-dependent phosphofructokinase